MWGVDLTQSSFQTYETSLLTVNSLTFKVKEVLFATLDLANIDDSYLLNNAINIEIKTYNQSSTLNNTFTAHYNKLYNSIIGILFFIEKDTDIYYKIKITSTNLISYGTSPSINIYKADGAIYSYDIFNRNTIIDSGINKKEINYFYKLLPSSITDTDIFGNVKSISYERDSSDYRIIETEDENGFIKTNSYDSNRYISSEFLYHSTDTNLKSISRYGSENGKTYEITQIGFVNLKHTYYYNTNHITKEKLASGREIVYTRDTNTLNTISKNVDSTLNDAVGHTYNHSLLTKVSSYNGDNEFAYKYDNRLRKKRITLPNSTYITKEYTDNFNNSTLNITNGSKIKTNYPNNYSETGYFDKLGNIKKLEKSNLYNINFNYNNKDQLSYMSCPEKYEYYEYNYDEYDRITRFYRATYGQQQVFVNNTYTNDKLTGASYSANGGTTSESYTYNESLGYNKDLISSINASNLFKTVFEYDKLRRLTSKTFINYSNNTTLFSKSYTYKSVYINNNLGNNSLPLVETETFNKGNTTTSFTYNYDSSCNISNIYKEGNIIQYGYLYDALNRLSHMSNYKNNTQYTYTYDARGNITQVLIETIPNYGSPVTIDTKNYSYNNPYWKDLLTSDGTYNYTYDSLGRMTSYKNNTLTWNNDSTLSSFGSNVSYTYDALKIRKTKTVNNVTTNYYYLGNKLLRETSPNKELLFYYNGDDVMGFNYNSNDYIYHKNIFGDVLEIYKVNSNGLSKVAEYSYDVFGNVSIIVNSNNIANINPFRYRSYYYDSETELYYLITRYYSPYLMRFISPDSLSYITDNIGDINVCNLFVYCNNNPVMYADPDGELAISIGLFIGLVGASFAIGFSLSVVSQGFSYGWENVNFLTFVQAGIDGLFSAFSTALAYTGICLFASMAISGMMGFAQYSIDSSFHNDFSWGGALLATGLATIGGAVSNRGIQHAKSIGSNLDKTGRTAVKAMLTAFDRYGYSNALTSTVNLWSARLTESLVRSFTKNFINTFVKNSLYSVISYDLSFLYSYLLKYYKEIK